MTPEGAGWVDVHHHAYHPELVQAMHRHGVTHMAPGVPVPTWTPSDSLRVMDGNGLAAAVLSVLLPNAVSTLDAGRGAGLVRSANEWTAELVRDHPDRFGALATLPMPDVDRTLAEIAHAYDVLGLDGVVVSASQADGRYLGDPGFAPVLDELDRREAVVFMHPNPSARCTCAGGPDFASAVPPPLVDFIMDTTRAVAQMLFGGTLIRYPRIRYVLAHAGGAVPFLAWRLALAGTWVLAGQEGGESVEAQLRRLYYETAQSAFPGALRCLRAVTDDSHILFGTDFPFMKDSVVAATRRALSDMDDLDPAGPGRDNVLALLPRLAARLGRAARPEGSQVAAS